MQGCATKHEPATQQGCDIPKKGQSDQARVPSTQVKRPQQAVAGSLPNTVTSGELPEKAHGNSTPSWGWALRPHKQDPARNARKEFSATKPS